MKITVDPNTDAGGFGYADAGEYRMRVAKVEHKEAKSADKFPGLSWQFEFADPNIPSAEKNKDGTDKKVGNVFEFTTLKSGDNAQFRLRQLSDALGLVWGEIDDETVIGMEFDAMIKIDSYNDEFNNKVAKFIPAE